MDEINSQEHQIALVIKQGRGFSSIRHPLYIEAILDGHFLDTNVVPPSGEPLFGEELTWVIERQRLKRLRTSTGHIRVNCYALIGPRKRESIGFLMLSLKSAQTHIDSHSQVTETWHKLITHGTSRPELLLSYCVRRPIPQQHILPNVTTVAEREILRCGGDYFDFTPQFPSERGIIQIGPANVGTDIFLLTVLVGEISNLHLLLPENVDSQPDGEHTFHFCYTVCGHTLNTKSFTVDLTSHAIVPHNEKIVIRIRSSLLAMKTYFKSLSVIPFLVMSSNMEVASTSVDVKMLIRTDSIEDFCSKYAIGNDGVVQSSQCYLTSARTQQVPVGDDGFKPSVNIILKFKFVERQVVPTVGLGINDSRTYTLLKHHSTGQTLKESDMLQQLCTSSLSAPQFMNNPESSKHSVSSHTEQLETKQSCSLDKPFIDNQENDSQQVQTTYLLLQQNNSFPPEGTHSDTQSISYQEKKNIISGSRSQETVHSHLSSGDRNFQQPLHQLAGNTVVDRTDALHHYDLNIRLECLQFHRVLSEMKVFFKFYHPNAEVVCAKHTEVLIHSAGEELPLKDVSCKMSFYSTPSQISHLLLASLPRVIMCSQTTGEQTLVLASTALDTAPLLCTDKRECCFSKGLRNISTREQVAVVKVCLVLEDVGVQILGDRVGSKFTECSVGVAIPNEVAVVKVVEELEDWKEKQQEIFKAELREKEKAHLALLMDEWYMKKTEIETALKNDVDKCSKLKEELEHTQEDLRLGLEKISEREKQVQLLKEKLESEWTRKLQELEDFSAKMEHEVDKELKLKAEKAELEQMVSTLEQEVKLWKETVKLRDAELEAIKENKLTKDSATYLFQELKMIEEKLNAALKLKSFYKEHWTRAMKEILRLKTENRNGLQISIKRNEWAQLQNQGALKTLHEFEAAKKEDQNVLKTIKEKANWLNLPKNQESSDATTKGSQSESSLLLLKQKSVDIQPAADKPSMRDIEHALQGMIAERDTLLRTGNYSVDDPIITKLNQDVSVLLTKLKS